MSRIFKIWLAANTALMVIVMAAAAFLPRSFALTAFSDIAQGILLLSGTAAFVPLILRSEGRLRFFWSLVTLGFGLWFVYQLCWTYYEVVIRKEVPDLWTWDAVLFLHIVPLMAAVALRPHITREENTGVIGQLDFALLLVWWFYLYVLIVMPWQYVQPDVATYNHNLNAVYLAEKVALLGGLLACWLTSTGAWRKLFIGLFFVTVCYSASSTLANWAIGHNLYYSGSFYDIPLVVAMASLPWVGLRTSAETPEPGKPGASTAYGVWVARSSMIAVFSLPIFAAWTIADGEIPGKIRVFRLALTFIAAFIMGIMVFLRQKLLDRELLRLLRASRESFDTLQRLQAQLLQSEKLASITQLLGGAAHELNNPITAMLGYSDMLMSTQLSSEQHSVATKIGQHVRRTKSLVASLISFARQAPTPKSPVDLNTLARTAVKLAQPQWETLKIEVHTQFDAALPKVLGDSNQLLQVCLQLLANCIHVLSENSGRVLTVSSGLRDGSCFLQIATEALGAIAAGTENSDDGLALSACQGILQEHRGIIITEHHENGSMILRVEMPPLEPVPGKAKSSTVPVMWQPQPYA